MEKIMTKKIYNEIVKLTKANLDLRHSLEKAFENPNGTHYNPNERAQGELETTEKAYFSALKSSSDQRDRLSNARENNQSQTWQDALEVTMTKMDYTLDRLEAEIVAWKQLHDERPDLELVFHKTYADLKEVWASRKKDTSQDARDNSSKAKVKLDEVEEKQFAEKVAYRTSII